MRRPDRPPPYDYFAQARPAAGEAVACLRLGPLNLELRGLDSRLQQLFLERYAPYARPGQADGAALRVDLVREQTDYFIDPPKIPEVVPVKIRCDGGRVRYLSYQIAGWFDTVDGMGQAVLATGEFEPFERAMENYVRSAVAWQAACRGGALVHAASAVWDGLGYLFYGESGAGKSTLSECNRRARVVSDDLSLVLPGDDGSLQLIGSPFRGTYTGGPPVLGSFPLVAGFRLIQAARAEVRDVPRIRALAELVGNLPFVAEEFGKRDDLFESVQRAFGAIRLGHLHFRKDDSYWDAIASAGYRP